MSWGIATLTFAKVINVNLIKPNCILESCFLFLFKNLSLLQYDFTYCVAVQINWQSIINKNPYEHNELL